MELVHCGEFWALKSSSCCYVLCLLAGFLSNSSVSYESSSGHPSFFCLLSIHIAASRNRLAAFWFSFEKPTLHSVHAFFWGLLFKALCPSSAKVKVSGPSYVISLSLSPWKLNLGWEEKRRENCWSWHWQEILPFVLATWICRIAQIPLPSVGWMFSCLP